jgi:hypothetical protein
MFLNISDIFLVRVVVLEVCEEPGAKLNAERLSTGVQ